MSNKVYQVVTDQIIALLEQGTVPWRKPWAGGEPRNLVSHKPYRGINALVLGLCSPYGSPWWLTYNQAKQLGGFVRQGEKSTAVLFFKMIEREQHDGSKDTFPIARYYRVFNIEQCEGVTSPAVETRRTINPIKACEQITSGYPEPPKIEHRQARAFYQPCSDTINMPPRQLFRAAESYYATLFHEQVHGTAHNSRLARPELNAIRFGSHAYSREELVAELGASFLCAEAGISPATIEGSASYIQSWLKKLKNDRRMLVQAASQAQQAADWILGRHRRQQQQDDEHPPSSKAA